MRTRVSSLRLFANLSHVKLGNVTKYLPSWKNVLLAVLAAVLLILAFPDFDFWFLAWFALVPLLWAIEREKESTVRSFILGWIFGVVFFFGTCWWLTFAPITYAAFPPVLAYFLLFCVTSVAAIFPGLFAAISVLRYRKVGPSVLGEIPVIWVAMEFLRYWLTGNNWNAVGYSMAFNDSIKSFSAWGGVYLVSFTLVALNAAILGALIALKSGSTPKKYYFVIFGPILLFLILMYLLPNSSTSTDANAIGTALVVGIQPNVPMAGLSQGKYETLRQRHVELAEQALATLPTENRLPTTVVFPESPMNFAYSDDLEFQIFIRGFARRNNVSVLFNSAEPDLKNGKYYNSAVMVGPDGKEVAQYDKIYLLPFGEAVPFPLDGIMPGFVGSFSYGQEHDLFPLGDAKAGVMICFESHFGQLSREFVRNGADVIIEMTNDGYLGPTPVLRQHLANAVFRAVETNRPVLRVTNVGITAYIDERGQVLDAAPTYTEATRVWSVAKSDGSQTFYVKYGDWFAWLCSIVTIGLLLLSFRRRKESKSD